MNTDTSLSFLTFLLLFSRLDLFLFTLRETMQGLSVIDALPCVLLWVLCCG